MENLQHLNNFKKTAIDSEVEHKHIYLYRDIIVDRKVYIL